MEKSVFILGQFFRKNKMWELLQKESSSNQILHKTVVLWPSSKFKSHFYVSSVEKEFSKNMSSYNFKIGL
ncbi:hypothetical protein LEP1GSC059_4462 [Leptospira noguchii serovar Panama str. CZ214]|uniref:Uncharacterized protein n=1 Tax=Leptospira noguchii serovar Panama str. CZ214 TaxID=1001595 RepID=T0FG44_9LEPT|nr:hypothetical protein LEP1GSC059_4462 [Leptospira noguchii serovar Panama str. CZ214]